MNEPDSISYFENKIDKLNSQLNIQSDKISSLQQEIVLLKQYSEYQNSKIDKVTSLIGDLLEKKSQDDAVLNSIQALQEDVDVSDIQGQMDQMAPHHGINPHQQQQQQQQQQMLHNQHRQVQRQQQQQQQQQSQQRNPHIQQDLSGHIDSNMDPALHQVAVATAAVQAQAQAQAQANHPPPPQPNQQQPPQQQLQGSSQLQIQTPQKPKKKTTKRKSEEAGFGNLSGSSTKARVEKKIEIVFIHNPTTVKEIYDEFYHGYKGQEPLCGLDAKYGKHEWRGDSRSKESKRYQRRKKLCDAIQRGILKYGKTADEVIEYLEDYRKEKSLTWLMNGNLPDDLDS